MWQTFLPEKKQILQVVGSKDLLTSLTVGKKWVPRKACIAKFDFKKCKESFCWRPCENLPVNLHQITLLILECHACQHGANVLRCLKDANFSFLHANVPINVPTCEKRVNYSTWYSKVPKACQIFNFACQHTKRGTGFSTIF